MTQQNRFKQNEEKIIARVEEMRQAGKISDEQARQMVQVAQQQANSPQSMQDMLAGEHAFKQRQEAGGMPTGAGEGLAPDLRMRRASGMPIAELERLEAERALTQEQNARVQNGPPGMQREIMTPGYNNSPAGGMPTTQLPLKTPLDDYPAGGFPIETVTNNMPAPGSHGFQLPPERGQPNTPQGILPRIVPERPTFGSTMNAMGGGLMDAGRSIGGGLSSMGKSLGAGAKSLFNDPSRMAMLQGGLSMMDPNTYYDKKGFGSVFTGLNKGLGAAQQGHAGVLARRKAVSDRALVDAQAGLAASGGKPSSDMQGYRAAKAQGYKGSYVDFIKIKAEAGKPATTINMENNAVSKGNTEIMKDFFKTHVPEARGIKKSLFTMGQARQLLEKGIVAGPLTNPTLWVSNFLEESLGFDMGEPGQRAARTREYISVMGGQVAAAISDFGAGTGLSDADRVFATNMAGQDPSDFTVAQLSKLLLLNEAKDRWELSQFNDRAQGILDGDKEKQLFGRQQMKQKLPPMSTALRDHIVESKKSGALAKEMDPETGKIRMPAGFTGGQKAWDAIPSPTDSASIKIVNIRTKKKADQ